VTVEATHPWVDSGLTVRKGERLSFECGDARARNSAAIPLLADRRCSPRITLTLMLCMVFWSTSPFEDGACADKAAAIVAIETLTRARNACSYAGMSNVLDNDTQQKVLALGRLGWTLRRIQQATAARRPARILRAAGIAVRSRGGPRWGLQNRHFRRGVHRLGRERIARFERDAAFAIGR